MGASKEKEFTGDEVCSHCGNSAPMQVVARHSEVDSHEDDAPGMFHMTWEAGRVYELLKCPACYGIALRSYVWHSEMPETVDLVPVRLYPTAETAPHGLPPGIAEAFSVARKIRRLDANLFGVQLGRILEMVCHDRKAEGPSLHQQLQNLAARGEIPEKLVHMATGLRRLRNIGAHASPGEELSPAEVPTLERLCLALLEYVYTAPNLLQQVEESLARLKSRNKKAPNKRMHLPKWRQRVSFLGR